MRLCIACIVLCAYACITTALCSRCSSWVDRERRNVPWRQCMHYARIWQCIACNDGYFQRKHCANWRNLKQLINANCLRLAQLFNSNLLAGFVKRFAWCSSVCMWTRPVCITTSQCAWHRTPDAVLGCVSAMATHCNWIFHCILIER